MASEPFIELDCEHSVTTWQDADEEYGHWHKLILGKSCCGTQTYGWCWDEADHSECRQGAVCQCPCHEIVREKFQWLREALGLDR